MLCSPKELLLAEESEGLMILEPEAKPGQPFAEYLGRSSGDVVLDLEVTPNRPDWNSVIGIARELAAVNGNPLKVPEIPAPPAGAEGGRNPETCPKPTPGVHSTPNHNTSQTPP